jgi:hypothetical protein
MWFYAEPCRIEKHAQEEKKYKRETKLNGGRRGGIHGLVREIPLNRDHTVLNRLILPRTFILYKHFSRSRTLQEWLECGGVLRRKIMVNSISHTLLALKHC